MRTATEILRQGIGLIPFATLDPNQGAAIIAAINEARKEAIEECAEVATVKKPEKQTESMGWNNVSPRDYTFFDVDKQSILSLIEQLK